MNIFSIFGFKRDNTFYKFDYQPCIILSNIPVTQVYVFCYDQQQRFCIVRDTGEKHYSLPGGGVEPGESPEAAARRELMEEAQIVCGELILLGTNIVSYYTGKQLIKQVQQVRYLAPATEILEFTKNYQGFETEERLFVTLEKLPKIIKWLSEPLPQKIIEQIVKILSLT
jgi:8-oxo-dGTP pyrophosphatase MutT (NUDIX family)